MANHCYFFLMLEKILKDNLKDYPLGSQSESLNPRVKVHIYSIWMNWNWYIYEYSPEQKIVFAYVEGFENEFGSVSVEELEYMIEKTWWMTTVVNKKLSDIAPTYHKTCR